MTDEQMNECREQLATIATVRHRLTKVTNWLECHSDITGKDPYVRTMDLVYQLNQTMEQLSFTTGQFMCFINPEATPDSILQAQQEGRAVVGCDFGSGESSTVEFTIDRTSNKIIGIHKKEGK